MSKHLSHDQFARCFVGKSGIAEQQHLNECPECRNELDRFGVTISSFRTAIRDRVDHEVYSPVQHVSRVRRAIPAPGLLLRWGFITASVLAFVMVPLVTREQTRHVAVQPPSTAADANALAADANVLMDAVNRHLSRTVPAPMEPIIALLPSDEIVTDSGGIQ
jgi:anti-sigma factor RsiW